MEKSLYQLYRTLEEPAKTILEFATLYFLAIKPETLFRTVNAFFKITNKPNITEKQFYHALRTLDDLGFLEEMDSQTVHVDNYSCEKIARQLSKKQSQFQPYVESISLIVHPVKMNRFNHRTNFLHLRLALLNKDHDRVQEIIRKYKVLKSDLVLEQLELMFFHPFDLAWLKKQPGIIQQTLAYRALEEQLSDFTPMNHLTPFINHVFKNYPRDDSITPDAYHMYLDWQFMRGNIQFFLSDKKNTDKYFRKGAALMRAFTRDMEKGLEEFEKIEKESPEEKPSPFNLFLLYYLLLLLTRPEDFPKLKEWAEKEEKNPTKTILKPVFKIFKSAILEQSDLPTRKFSSDTYKKYNILIFVHSVLVVGLLQYLLESENLSNYFNKLLEAFTWAQDGGYEFLKEQLSELLLAVKDEIFIEEPLFLHKKQQKFLPICKLIEPRPAWERMLSRLKSWAENDVTPKESKERLIWVIGRRNDLDFGRSVIEPKIQKKTKQGKWSRGRRVSLDDLRTKYSSLLTSRDSLVLGKILREYRTFYWSISLNLLEGLVLKMDNIYNEYDPEHPIQFTRGEYLFNIKKENGLYTFYFVPPIEAKYTYLPIDDYHVEVFIANKALLQLKEILDPYMDGIPVENEQVLQEVIQLVSRAVPVQQGKIEIVTDEQQESEPEFILRIYNSREGFALTLKVRPIPGRHVYLDPGEGEQFITFRKDGKLVSVKRSLARERQKAEKILQQLPTLQKYKKGAYYWVIPTPEESLKVFAEIRNLKEELTIQWPKNFEKKLYGKLDFSALSLHIGSGVDWFELSGDVTIDENLVINFRNLLEQWENSNYSEFVEISPGKLVQLTERMLNFLKKVHSFTTGKGEKVRLHRFSALALPELEREIPVSQKTPQWKTFFEKFARAQQLKAEVPEGFQGTLRPYQVEGYQWLRRLAELEAGACLADDMGLGKTIQALALILSRAEGGATLVIAPASVVYNWEKEARRFTPSLNPIVLSNQAEVENYTRPEPYHLVLCNYHIFQRYGEHFLKFQWQTIVLDEAQAIKNITAKRTQAALKLQGKFRMITTGTPIENHLQELWTLFRFLLPGLLGSWKSFREKFVLPIMRYQDNQRLEHLKRLIQPFVLRRLKEQVIKELPPKTEINVYIELSPEEMAFYEAIREQALKNLATVKEEGNGQQRIRILAELMRMRRAVCHPKLINPSVKLPGTKITVLKDLLQELIENRHRTLVFSQFVDFLKIVEKELKKSKISYQYLDGQTPVAQRQKRIEAFQNGEGDVFLISLKAGGLGLNLTAASYVIHLDPWWNPAVEDQASDRAHRIGQTQPVTVYRFITRNTIEEKILSLHQRKRELAESLLQGADTVHEISLEEMLALITG